MQKRLQINNNCDVQEIVLNSDIEVSELAMELTNLIFSQYELIILEKILKKNYNYLEKGEQMFIKEECRRHLNKERKNIQKLIMNKIIDYLQTEHIINIEGFVAFRLQEYISEIENTLDFAVNELIVEREYEQLIDGLVLYIELQVPLIDTVNIVCDHDKYIVSDSKGNEIFTLIHYDDVLLDVILTLAPRSIIIIHSELFSNRELLDTLIKVFGSRVCFLNTVESYINPTKNTSNLDKE